MPDTPFKSQSILPRIYCIPDPAGRVAAVIQTLPRKWWRLGRWDLVSGKYEEGAWFRGKLFPQRCDVSPDGRWFSYFAFKNDSDWPAGSTYNAISRLPWLKALAAWEEYGTWSRGQYFVSNPNVWEVGNPTVGDSSLCRVVGGMMITIPAQFAVERRRGWLESAETPPRDPSDMWDERRNVVMEKPSSLREQLVLAVTGQFQAFRTSPHSSPPDAEAYRLNRKRASTILKNVQWADWTCEGHLAIATGSGQLQFLDHEGKRVLHEIQLEDSVPKPTRAPEWAEEW